VPAVDRFGCEFDGGMRMTLTMFPVKWLGFSNNRHAHAREMHITSAQSTYNAISPKIECAYDEP
jgi:hypothetical protein